MGGPKEDSCSWIMGLFKQSPTSAARAYLSPEMVAHIKRSVMAKVLYAALYWLEHTGSTGLHHLEVDWLDVQVPFTWVNKDEEVEHKFWDWPGFDRQE